MARIEEYNPQVAAEGPVGGTSPNLEQVGDLGRGISDFGKDVEQSASLVERRNEQTEVSQASQIFSDARLDFNQQIDQQTQDGTLDSQKLKEQYENFVSSQSGNFDTAKGKNYFDRQAERAQATLVGKANRNQARVAASNAQASYQNELNSDTSVVQNNPEQYGDVLDSNLEKINAMVEAGSLPATTAEKYKNEVGKKMSQAAVEGIISSDYDRAVGSAQQIIDSQGPDAKPLKADMLEQAVKGFTSATDKMKDGSYDEYLSAQDKTQLEQKERQMQSAAVTEINRLVVVKKAAQQEQAQDWVDKNFASIKTNQLSTKAILNAPIPWQQKNELINIAQASTRSVTTDPIVANQLMARITAADNDADKINDPGQLMPYVGKGISAQDYERMRTLIDNSPSGQALNQNRKQIMELAKSKLVKSNSAIGMTDPDGEYQLMQFTNALQKQESQLRSQGKPVDELYDVTSPNFFGKKIGQFQKTPQQILEDQANQARGLANPPKPIDLVPGSSPPIQPPAETKTVKGVPYTKVPGGWKRVKSGG